MSNITIKIPAASAPFLIRAIETYSDLLKEAIKQGLEAPNWNMDKVAGTTVATLEKPRKTEEKNKRRQGRTWTPEARAKQSELARQRWAKAKQKLSPVSA